VKNPLRTEAEAFGYVVLAGAVALVVGLSAWLGGGAAAAGAVVGVVVGGAAGIWIARAPRVREPAIWEREWTGAPSTLRVLAAAATDADVEVALRVARLRSGGGNGMVDVVVRGPDAEPLASIEAAVARFRSDEVVLAGYDGDLVALARERLAIPVTAP
jgi:hypothetical protein